MPQTSEPVSSSMVGITDKNFAANRQIQRVYDYSTGETLFVKAPIWHKQDFLIAASGDVTPWVSVEGSDAQTAVALVAGARGGVYRITTGNNSGTYADDGVQLVTSLGLTPIGGRIACEARLKMASSVATGSMGFGFTDTVALEEPTSISTTTLTTNATDGVHFVYDTAQTTDRWYAVGVKNDVDAVDGTTGLTDTAPVADTYQTLRIELDADGVAYFYIDGVLKKRVADACTVSASVLLTPILWVNATTTASIVVDVDYLAFWGTR